MSHCPHLISNTRRQHASPALSPGLQCRAVPKQLDPRWVASRDDKPKVETLWQVEDRLPGVSTSDGVAMESH